MVDRVLAIISICISLSALALSLFGFCQSRASIVKDFFAQGDNIEMKKLRKVIYDIYNQNNHAELILDELKTHSDEVSQVISYYDFWGLMVKKGYLPKWAFQASSKFTTINIYNKTKPYIEYRRLGQPDYASHFKWLISKINYN